MPVKVTVSHPEAGASSLFIDGLGTFQNGTQGIVDDDQCLRYQLKHGVAPEDAEIRGVHIVKVEEGDQ